MHAKVTLPRTLVCVGFSLLIVAWVFSTPPGAGPDEPAHYIRAVSVGRLVWLGSPTSQTVMASENDRQLRLLLSLSRVVPVPPELAAPDAWYCTVVNHDASAACLTRTPEAPAPSTQPTYVGSYAPFAYVPAGLATRLGRDPVSALTWGRIFGGLVALGFILTAVCLVFVPGSPASIVGILLAVTPMVTFTSAVLSTSSPEVAASLCLAASAVRLWRNPRSAAAAMAAGISAFVVGISRPLGPAWVFLAVLLILSLVGRHGLRVALSGRGRGATALFGLVGVGLTVNMAWQLVVLPPSPRPLGDLVGFIGPSIASLPAAFGEAVGYFGWQDVLMPRWAYAAWGAAFVVLLTGALTVGRRRELRTLEGLLASAFLAALAVAVVAVMPTGYLVRGRYILPALMPVSLVAAEILHRRGLVSSRFAAPPLVLGIGLVAAALQLVGWYTMARRYAVGNAGPWLFLGRAAWQPVLGWGTWLSLAVLGTLCLALAFAPGIGRRRPL
ncbi:MAG: hypothetical protein NVSMB17_09800 [Candidatus Dormibacteria bacterium]